jgi:hypothetical protein
LSGLAGIARWGEPATTNNRKNLRSLSKRRRGDTVKRITVAVAIWSCATVPALAQDTGHQPLVGVMWTGAAANSEPFATQFREELSDAVQLLHLMLEFFCRRQPLDARRL